MEVEKRDLIDLVQCYYRTRDSDDPDILERSDKIVDTIWSKYHE